MTTIGFIILRHVNSLETNELWKECYRCIRKFYPTNKILLIDDNSNYDFVSSEFETYETTIVQSEYPARGELLPYIYYLRNPLFDRAVIIHDGVFMQTYVEFPKEDMFLWYANHDWDDPVEEMKRLSVLSNSNEILSFYQTQENWKVCFGGMSIISYRFLQYCDAKYTLSNLIPVITTRQERMCFERIIGCIFLCERERFFGIKSPMVATPMVATPQSNFKNMFHISTVQANVALNNDDIVVPISLLGNIGRYCPWGYSYSRYLVAKLNLPIIKVWSGR